MGKTTTAESVPDDVVAKLAKQAKLPIPEIIDCLPILLHRASGFQNWRPAKRDNPSLLIRNWGPIARKLAEAQSRISRLTRQEEGFFNHLMHDRILADGSKGQRLRHYCELLRQLVEATEIAAKAVDPREAHRPRSIIFDTARKAFAAGVYYHIGQIGGSLRPNKNTGGSLRKFLETLAPYSKIPPPSNGTLKKVAELVDQNYRSPD